MSQSCRCLNCITPPYLLKQLLESKDRNIRDAALNTLLTTARLRGERSVWAATFSGAPGAAQRTIFDCRNSSFLPTAGVMRKEEDAPSPDKTVNAAFDGFGATRDFYDKVFNRDSVDGKGMRLDGYVHYGSDFNNAFWDGREMVFGDGDGVIFTDFTLSLDVIAHELTHGVTEFTANLEYHKQSGALNESISDVFGSLVKQWSLGQTAAEANWLIGEDIFTPDIGADALRSMKDPGHAYNNPQLGKDQQSDHMDRFVVLPDTEPGDWGGVHYNSGIPNKAFYLTAIAIGGNAWEAPGHIWYESLLASNDRTQFQEFADTTYAKAGQLYGNVEQQAVVEAWSQVGIRITGVAVGARNPNGKTGPIVVPSTNGDTLSALPDQIEAIAAQVKLLSRDVKSLKDKR